MTDAQLDQLIAEAEAAARSSFYRRVRAARG
jgi:hypothetical protein